MAAVVPTENGKQVLEFGQELESPSEEGSYLPLRKMKKEKKAEAKSKSQSPPRSRSRERSLDEDRRDPQPSNDGDDVVTAAAPKTNRRKKNKSRKKKETDPVSEGNHSEVGAPLEPQPTISETLSVTIHRVDPLRPQKNLVHPYVRSSLIDLETGLLISRDLSVIQTPSCDIRGSKTLAPTWNCSLQFPDNLASLSSNPNAAIFFELVDYLQIKSGKTWGENETKLIPVAWAFLKLKSANGILNIERLSRLQLFFSDIEPKDKKKYKLLKQKHSEIHRSSKNETLVQKYLFGDRYQYPSTLYITLNRRAAELQKDEIPSKGGSEELQHLASEGAGMSQPMISEYSLPMSPKWQRQPGQVTRIPNTLQSRLWAGENGAMTVAYSNNGFYLAVASCNHPHYPINLFSVAPMGSEASLLKSLKPGEFHATGMSSKQTLLTQFRGHRNLVYDIAWSADDSILASASSDGLVYIWNVASRLATPILGLTHPCFVYAAQFHTLSSFNDTSRLSASFCPSPNHVIVTGGYDGVIRRWEFSSVRDASPGPVHTDFQAHDDSINSIVFDPQGIKLFTGDSVGVIKIWSWSEASNSFQLLNVVADKEIQGDPINGMSLHPLGKRLLVHARDNMVRILDLRTFSFMLHLSGATNCKTRIRSSFSACGSYIAAGSEDGSVSVWSSDTGLLVHTFSNLNLQGAINDVRFHPHDNLIAIAGFGHHNPVLVFGYTSPNGEDHRSEHSYKLGDNTFMATTRTIQSRLLSPIHTSHNRLPPLSSQTYSEISSLPKNDLLKTSSFLSEWTSLTQTSTFQPTKVEKLSAIPFGTSHDLPFVPMPDGENLAPSLPPASPSVSTLEHYVPRFSMSLADVEPPRNLPQSLSDDQTESLRTERPRFRHKTIEDSSVLSTVPEHVSKEAFDASTLSQSRARRREKRKEIQHVVGYDPLHSLLLNNTQEVATISLRDPIPTKVESHDLEKIPVEGSLRRKHTKRRKEKEVPIAPLFFVKGLYPYTPQREDELALQPGDVLAVLEERTPEWWIAATIPLSGVPFLPSVDLSSLSKGWIPSNFVRKFKVKPPKPETSGTRVSLMREGGLSESLSDTKTPPSNHQGEDEIRVPVQTLSGNNGEENNHDASSPHIRRRSRVLTRDTRGTIF